MSVEEGFATFDMSPCIEVEPIFAARAFITIGPCAVAEPVYPGGKMKFCDPAAFCWATRDRKRVRVFSALRPAGRPLPA